MFSYINRASDLEFGGLKKTAPGYEFFLSQEEKAANAMFFTFGILPAKKVYQGVPNRHSGKVNFSVVNVSGWNYWRAWQDSNLRPAD